MGSAISFRLNPKNESDKRILDWLEEKSSQPGYQNQTELIKQALLVAIEQENSDIQETGITEWMEEAIHKVTQEFTKVVQESSQNMANNMFAGVMGAMMQQMNMGVMPMNLGQVQQVAAAGCANPSVISKEMAAPDTEQNLQENELVSDNSMSMDNDTRSKLGSLFDMDDD